MRPTIDERIKGIDRLIVKYPELGDYLELGKARMLIIREVEKNEWKGTNLEIPIVVKDIQDRLLKEDRPIVQLLKDVKFNRDLMLPVLKQLLDFLKNIDEKACSFTDRILKYIDEGSLNLDSTLTSILKNDVHSIRNLSARLGLDINMLYDTFLSLVQPLLEEMARVIDRDLLERWGRGTCPVCGRLPTIAKIVKGSKKRYMLCPLCGAEYLTDLFYCPFCENVDPYKLKFIAFEEFPELSMDVCELCKHYVKVVDENKLESELPAGLEDLLTFPLDVIAEREGLIRKNRGG